MLIKPGMWVRSKVTDVSAGTTTNFLIKNKRYKVVECDYENYVIAVEISDKEFNDSPFKYYYHMDKFTCSLPKTKLGKILYK